MEKLGFFMNNQAKFYDSNGYKCTTYPLSLGAGTYNKGKGKKVSGKEQAGTPYLAMEHSRF